MVWAVWHVRLYSHYSPGCGHGAADMPTKWCPQPRCVLDWYRNRLRATAAVSGLHAHVHDDTCALCSVRCALCAVVCHAMVWCGACRPPAVFGALFACCQRMQFGNRDSGKKAAPAAATTEVKTSGTSGAAPAQKAQPNEPKPSTSGIPAPGAPNEATATTIMSLPGSQAAETAPRAPTKQQPPPKVEATYVLVGAGTASFFAMRGIREADPNAKVYSHTP